MRVARGHAVKLALVGVGAVAASAVSVAQAPGAGSSSSWACVPTRAHHAIERRNPNYKPGAPVRSSVGKGHLLVGIVRSSANCRPIARARIEFFQAGPQGYSNGVTSWAGRATVFTKRDGSYRFESPFPSRYAARPHIHLPRHCTHSQIAAPHVDCSESAPVTPHSAAHSSLITHH